MLAGMSRTALEALRDRIFQLSRALVSPSIAPQFESFALETGKEVLVVWMAATGDIHAFKGDVFIRVGDKVTKATVSQVASYRSERHTLTGLHSPVRVQR